MHGIAHKLRLFYAVPFLCFFFLVPLPLIAQEAGPAFSDPTQTFPMPEEWQQQPIVYADDDRGSDLVITLDQQLYSQFLPVVNRFGPEHGLKISVHRGTCGISAGKLLNREVDIAGFCCPPERTDRLPDIRYHTIGIVPMMIIIHPDNPVTNLTTQQVRQLFSGDIRHWEELTESGRQDNHPVIPITRLHCKRRPGHWRLILDKPYDFSASSIHVSTIPDMLEVVADERNAIGFSTHLHIDRLGYSQKFKIVKINNSVGDTDDLVSRRYPFYRVFSLTTWEQDMGQKNKTGKLLRYIEQAFQTQSTPRYFVPVSSLRAADWRFNGDELIGEPQ